MNGIKFTVYLPPLPQPRQKHAKNRSYIPKKHPIHAYKKEIREAAVQALGEKNTLSPPLLLITRFYFPRPKADTSRKYRNFQHWHTGARDFDNLAKAVADACTKPHPSVLKKTPCIPYVIENDGHIALALQAKIVIGDAEKPRVEVVMREIDSGVNDTMSRIEDSGVLSDEP